MAEQQRRGAYVGLAAASALVVLIASGVAVSRLGSHDRPARSGSETAAPTSQATGPAASPDQAPGSGVAPHGDAAAGVGGAASPTARPVASASGAAAQAAGSPTASGAGSEAVGSPSPPRSSGAASSPPGAGRSSPPDRAPGSDADGASPGGGSPPAPERSPGPAPLLAVSISAGQGATGGVVGAGFGDSPDADVTVGTTTIVGDAPTSHGTAIGLGSRFLHPPPTLPVLPG